MRLTSKEVKEVFIDCLADKKNESDNSTVIVDGVAHSFLIDKQKVNSHMDKINEFLNELSDTFKEGMSFLALPFDKNNNQWGEQMNAEQLMVLGIAAGRIKLCLPKEMWNLLPGGVPYIEITKGDKNND